jgi:uncharacterized protein with FMN-binding domain
MLKKFWLVLGVIFLLIVCVVAAFYLRFQSMASNVKHQYENIKPLDLRQVADGTYTGSFSDFLVSVKVSVSVKRHRITGIKVIEQKCGPGYEALDTASRILKAQSARVDAVTGASGSSKAIMIAVQRALTGK